MFLSRITSLILVPCSLKVLSGCSSRLPNFSFCLGLFFACFPTGVRSNECLGNTKEYIWKKFAQKDSWLVKCITLWGIHFFHSCYFLILPLSLYLPTSAIAPSSLTSTHLHLFLCCPVLDSSNLPVPGFQSGWTYKYSLLSLTGIPFPECG